MGLTFNNQAYKKISYKFAAANLHLGFVKKPICKTSLLIILIMYYTRIVDVLIIIFLQFDKDVIRYEYFNDKPMHLFVNCRWRY